MQQFTISLYLAAMMIANSCDIELNPGPPAKFPCGVCAKAVKWTDRGLCCDSCQQWFHIDCQGMSKNIYEIVGASNFSWQCLQCGLRNYSSSLCNDTSSITTPRFPHKCILPQTKSWKALFEKPTPEHSTPQHTYYELPKHCK